MGDGAQQQPQLRQQEGKDKQAEHRHSVQGGDEGVPPRVGVEEQATLEIGRYRSDVVGREQEGWVLAWAVLIAE
jgi:hypothetical protein